MKDKIINMKNEGMRIIPSKFSKQELIIIDELTIFLGNVSFSEKCYNIINDINKIILCKCCNKNKPTFLRISTGYRDFCSHECKNKWIYENTNVKEQIKQSSIKSYNNFSKQEIREQQNKRLQTMVDRNIITDISERNLKYHYSREVWRFTNSSDIKKLKNFEKRGAINIDGTYQLDHKYSIYQGFKDNIPPWIIGNICNLEMISSKENSSKKQKCSISKDELFNFFDRNVNKL